jgi:hypothetical protein
MKIFGDSWIFRDPIKWANGMVGSRTSFLSYFFLNVFVGVLTIYVYLKGTLSLSYVLLIVSLFIIIQPFYYLYALRKLVLELKKQDKIQAGTD